MATKKSAAACRDCEGTHDVIDGLCAECEANYEWCEVCQKDQSRDHESCRHLFFTSYGVTNGAGASSTDWDDCRKSFFALLDILTDVPRDGFDGWCWCEYEPAGDLIAAMERRILRDNFWTFIHGFLLSTPDLDFFEGRTDLHPTTTCLSFAHVRGHMLINHPRHDEACDGFGFLETLCAKETKQANARVARWIGEWRMGRVGKQSSDK